AISAGFLGESGFLDRKKVSVTVLTQLPCPARKYFLARQAEPKISRVALGGCGPLVDVHRGTKGSLQHRIVNACKVPFEDCRVFRIVSGSAKESWRRWSPLQPACVDL